MYESAKVKPQRREQVPRRETVGGWNGGWENRLLIVVIPMETNGIANRRHNPCYPMIETARGHRDVVVKSIHMPHPNTGDVSPPGHPRGNRLIVTDNQINMRAGIAMHVPVGLGGIDAQGRANRVDPSIFRHKGKALSYLIRLEKRQIPFSIKRRPA